jgi:hypothetical protein
MAAAADQYPLNEDGVCVVWPAVYCHFDGPMILDEFNF